MRVDFKKLAAREERTLAKFNTTFQAGGGKKHGGIYRANGSLIGSLEDVAFASAETMNSPKPPRDNVFGARQTMNSPKPPMGTIFAETQTMNSPKPPRG